MHETITGEHLRLCMHKGTKIETSDATARYYYKGLCVVTSQRVPSTTENVVTAFWTLQDLKILQKFDVLLSRCRRCRPKKNIFKKASSTLLMLRQEAQTKS